MESRSFRGGGGNGEEELQGNKTVEERRDSGGEERGIKQWRGGASGDFFGASVE